MQGRQRSGQPASVGLSQLQILGHRPLSIFSCCPGSLRPSCALLAEKGPNRLRLAHLPRNPNTLDGTFQDSLAHFLGVNATAHAWGKRMQYPLLPTAQEGLRRCASAPPGAAAAAWLCRLSTQAGACSAQGLGGCVGKTAVFANIKFSAVGFVARVLHNTGAGVLQGMFH